MPSAFQARRCPDPRPRSPTHCSVPVLFPQTFPYLPLPPIGPKTGASLEGWYQSTAACALWYHPTLPPTASQSGASLVRVAHTPRGGTNGRKRTVLPARGAESWEAPPRPGSKSGGRRARMWRVTLNCSRSQTLGVPARPRSPAALLPRQGPRPPRPHARASPTSLLSLPQDTRPLPLAQPPCPACHRAQV